MKLNYIDTKNKYGNMNTAKQFYPEDMSFEERNRIFLERRIKVGNDYGFDGHKVFMADQKNKNGSYLIMSNKYVNEHPNGWSDIDEDILIIHDRVPGVVVGHPVADCPVIMATDNKNKVTAVCHCSAELVDKMLPCLTIDALKKASKFLHSKNNIKDEDISVYISACAGPNWEYDCYPSFAKDEKVWKYSIIEGKNGHYNINIRQALLDQLKNCGIKNIGMNLADTITDQDYYSNSVARFNPEKAGRNFIGAFYSEDEYQKVKQR